MITIGCSKYANTQEDIRSTGVWNLQEVYSARIGEAWPNKINSYTFHFSNTYATNNVSTPSTALQNDIAVLFDVVLYTNAGTSYPTTVIPDNFTQLREDNILSTTSPNNSIRSIISYKKLTSADPDVTFAGMTANASAGQITRKTLLVFRPDSNSKASRTLNTSLVIGGATTVAPGDQNLNLSTVNSAITPMIGLAHYVTSNNNTGGIATRVSTGLTMTEVINSNNSNALYQYVKFIIYNRNDTTANGVISMADSGLFNVLQSGAIHPYA
jgi:hypothetical protein